MNKWDDHYLSFDQVRVLTPLREAILWLEAQNISGGALHIIVEDGNYTDENVDFCINYIKSGDYAHNIKQWKMDVSDEHIVTQLEIAEALRALSENVREMVCSGNGLTEDLFNHLYNQPIIQAVKPKIYIPS